MDKLSKKNPQRESGLCAAVNQTSGVRRVYFIHIWGVNLFIHTIHTPYYYYESIIILIYRLNPLRDYCTIHK